ncbi:MAG: Ig-like domain-containing protein, partial [Rhodobacter sp.]|nr:Ig-like domain-containing protein [Rhodobacter sp.]
MANINGTNGDDLIDRSAQTTGDNIDGGNGDDTIIAGSGNDTIDGGRGNDDVNAGGGDDFVDGGDGNDTLVGGTGNDTLRGVKNDDEMHGGDGNDELDGGSGNDTLFGDDGNDELLGVSGDDLLDGGAGDDTVEGGSGEDVVSGGTGNDIVDGGSGHDTLIGGEGDDTIIGGSGHDVAVFSGSIADFTLSTSGTSVIVEDLNGLGGTDTVEDDVEFLQFDDYTLDLTGDANAPVALTGNQVTDEDNALGFTLTVADFDGDAVLTPVVSVTGGGTISVVGGPVPGSIGIGSATLFDLQFDPGSAYQSLAVGDSAVETVTVTMTDANGDTNTQTFNITINGVNDTPVAVNDVAITDEDTSVNVSVLANDSDIDGDSLTVIGASAGHGAVVINGDGTLTYTPDADYNGDDTITYTISDGNGGEATASVDVTVNPVNDAPTAVDDVATTDEDTSVVIDVLANDSDIDGDSLTVIGATADHGMVVINGDGTLTYTPDADYNGDDTITYTISDGNETSSASVAVTVNPVNDAPTAVDDVATTDEDTSVVIDVLANDSDLEGDDLSVIGASAANGSVVINEDGTLTYTPNEDYNGNDTITYTISDGNGGEATASVDVTV